ncbi:MAG: hypothetical protein LC768_03095 [Acidobacteria bacterium]|nr:hypothetical protein [Acidobacteriota bacterium]MCA1637318.1 hypothetical protein [Acidobacteriota bacterium]
MQNQNFNTKWIYFTMIAIWFAIFVSQFLLLLVIYFAKGDLFNFDFTKPLLSNENSVLLIVLSVLGIITFSISLVLKLIALKKLINNRPADTFQNSVILAIVTIFNCALCEATVLFGLVSAFSFDYQYFFLWFALGILGMILHFPRRENLIADSYKNSF